MRVGSDLEAVCRRCGDVWHVVIALTGGRVAKVECRECSARHAYRAVRGASPGPERPKPGGRARRSRKASIVEADPSRPRRPFSPRESYEVGDRVTHPSLGEGVVQAVNGPTKVEILFAVGTKTMVHGRGD
jgi:hypothetical protein